MKCCDSLGHGARDVETLEDLHALQCISSSGTHSPLDICGVSTSPENFHLFPLSLEQTVRVFGKQRVQFEDVSGMRIWVAEKAPGGIRKLASHFRASVHGRFHYPCLRGRRQWGLALGAGHVRCYRVDLYPGHSLCGHPWIRGALRMITAEGQKLANHWSQYGHETLDSYLIQDVEHTSFNSQSVRSLSITCFRESSRIPSRTSFSTLPAPAICFRRTGKVCFPNFSRPCPTRIATAHSPCFSADDSASRGPNDFH